MERVRILSSFVSSVTFFLLTILVVLVTVILCLKPSSPIFHSVLFKSSFALTISEPGILTGQVEPISSLFVNTPFQPARQIPGADPVKANELLEKTEWKMGNDGFRHKITVTKTTKIVNKKKVTEETKDDKILTLSVTTVNQKENSAAAEFIKTSWEKIGIKTEIKLFTNDAIKKEILKTKDYDILLYGEILGRDFDPFLFWHTSQVEGSGLNLANYSNRTMDEALEQARKTSDLAVRADKYRIVDEILTRDAPAVFLWTPVYYYAIAKSFKGVGLTALNEPSERFLSVGDWYTKTTRVWKQ
jgi:ABC-type transport system substrate-binding protein